MTVMRVAHVAPDPMFEKLTAIELLNVFNILQRAQSRIGRTVAYKLIPYREGNDMVEETSALASRVFLTLAQRVSAGHGQKLAMLTMPTTEDWKDDTAYVWNC